MWTDASLFVPQIICQMILVKALFHLHVITRFKIHLPRRIIWIGVALNFDMPFEAHLAWAEQSHRANLLIARGHWPTEIPATPVGMGEIFLFEPSVILVTMTAMYPTPEQSKQIVVEPSKGIATDDMTIVVAPSAQHGIELKNQLAGATALMGLHDLFNLFDNAPETGFRWGDEQFVLVNTHVKTQEVKAF